MTTSPPTLPDGGACCSPPRRCDGREIADTAVRLTAQFRAWIAEHVSEPAWKGLVLRLRAASPEFDELWSRQDVGAPQDCTKTIAHPVVGTLRLNTTSLWLDPRRDTRLITYTPANDATRDALPTLAALAT